MALSHAISAGMITSGGVLGGPIGTGGAIPSGTYVGRSAANGLVADKFNQLYGDGFNDTLKQDAVGICILVRKTARAFVVELVQSQPNNTASSYTRWYEADGTLNNLGAVDDRAIIFEGAPAVYTGFRWVVDSQTNSGVQGQGIAAGVHYHPTDPYTYSEYGETGTAFTGLKYHNSNIAGFDTVNLAGDYRAVQPVIATYVQEPAVWGSGPTVSDENSTTTISLLARAAGYQDTTVCTFQLKVRIYLQLYP